MSREVSVRISVLDNQIVDRDEVPVGRVDDLELSVPGDGGRPRVEAILTGSEALGERLGGLTGAAMASVSRRLRPPSGAAGPARVEVGLVEALEPLVKLSAPLRELDGVAALERWLSEKVIQRLPGGDDADL